MLMEIHTLESICLNYGPVVFYRRGEVFRRGGGGSHGFQEGKMGISRRQRSTRRNIEPMRIQSKNNQTAQSAGKRGRPSRDWFEFCI